MLNWPLKAWISKSDAAGNPFDAVVEKSAELRHAAIDNIQEEAETPLGQPAEQAGSVDDFFADGFSDLLQEELATSDQLSQPAAESAEADFDFAEAFSRQLEADAPAAQPAIQPEHVEPVQSSDVHQNELALENDFAKAFASELAGDEPVFASEISRGVDAQPGDGAVFHEPQSSYDDRVEPEHASLAPEIAGASGRSGNGFKLAVGALICALVAGLGVVGWGYYSGQGDGSEPAVIKADTSPAKVKPADPGGEEIANQDNEVYNQVAGTTESEPRQEELISSRQQPVEIKPKADSRLSPNNDSASSETAPLGLSPKRVKTLTVKPDGTIISSDGEVAATAQETSTANGETASLSPTAANTDAEANSGGTIGIDGASATGKLAVPEPSPLPAAQELALTPVAQPHQSLRQRLSRHLPNLLLQSPQRLQMRMHRHRSRRWTIHPRQRRLLPAVNGKFRFHPSAQVRLRRHPSITSSAGSVPYFLVVPLQLNGQTLRARELFIGPRCLQIQRVMQPRFVPGSKAPAAAVL